MHRCSILRPRGLRGWRELGGTVKRWLEYEVRVYTGDKRGAGTNANVFLSLRGNRDDSEQQYLYGGRFERNSVDRFVIDTPYDLGEIQTIIVGTDKMGDSFGWFLEKIEVNGRPFHCSNWIGGNQGHEKILTPFEVSQAARSIRSTVVSAQLLDWVTSACALPHPDKTRKGMKATIRGNFGWAGEDAYFVLGKGRSIPALGVADGVHQWVEKGINAGEFSRGLMENARQVVSEVDELTKLTPLDVMRESYARIKEKYIQGSCTACILTLDGEDMVIKSANLGDSGFMVYGEWDTFNRPREIFKAAPQEHEFGFPYQLGHHAHSSSPDDAALEEVNVRENDLIVCGSDGLLDNVSSNEMTSIVQDAANRNDLSRRAQVKIVAQNLTQAAWENSVSKTKVTPYSEAASDEFNLVFRGGKKDDITVLAAFVHRAPRS